MVTNKAVMSELDHDKPLRLRLAGKIPKPEPGSRLKFFFSTQSVYQGPLEHDAIARILAAGRAESLEQRLVPRAKQRLRHAIEKLATDLRDLSILIDESEERIRQALRVRPGRHLLLTRNPPELDPAYPQLVALRSKLRPKDGVIWGDPSNRGMLYLTVKWAEWPGLKSMYDDRFHLLTERDARVRKWIQTEFDRHPMALFKRQ